nr:FecR domain-containing protein [Geminicoccaceae bacterium]
MRLWRPLALFAALWLPGHAGAQVAPCPPDGQVASIEALEGDVRLDGNPVRQADLPLAVCAGSVISTGAASRVQIHADGADTGFRLDENSSSRLRPPPAPESGIVDLLRGGLFFLSQVRRSLTINTPYMTAGVEGTEVLVRADGGGENRLELTVYDGRIALSQLAGGTAPPAAGVSAGQRLTLPRDGSGSIAAIPGGPAGALRLAAGRELAWTLHYPPLADDPARAFPPGQAEAARLLGAGRADAALAALAAIPDGSAGAPTRDALLAMVALAQGEREKALELASGAVRRRPDSAPVLLARSYAEQSLRQLDAAQRSARLATGAPDADGLAWARLAEVEMMFGDVGAAADAARRSAAIGRTPLAQIILGFTDLANFQAEEAVRRFRAALARDSEQPLGHLGLGLALIRQGRLAEGRRSLEIAATLDPTQSLLRSYLGKAFFEERRDARAATQLGLAKELDPTDPTPWLYDAIRKQLDNRPVAALRDLERSIELNDDRATFRSQLRLDQDRAVRTAGLGRIYQDLGFDQLGRSVAGKAVVEDPTSGAARRLMADLALDAPRQEISRVSDLLKSRLLSPPSTNIIQPSLGFTDLDIVRSTGPARIGFNEYSSLFDSDGVRLNANGVVGTEDTLGNELIASGLLGRTALSLGQFHYQTDGSRTNNDIEHDIYNIFGQVGLTADSSVQVEYV